MSCSLPPHHVFGYVKIAALFMAGAVIGLRSADSGPISIDWVTVGDAGNAADTSGYGAVGYEYGIGKYEFTNQQYAAFLNSAAKTDPYFLWIHPMNSDTRGGITRSGAAGGYVYAVKPDMGDKPVNNVTWFSAARLANWLTNGATDSSSTETGAYTLNGINYGAAPARNPGATFYVPTADEWYKAAFYKGGGTNSGYWTYATQSDSPQTPVTAGPTGIGSAGPAGNFANFFAAADWNGENGNVTTVGTNGGPSAYGTFDMSGNVSEMTDGDGTAGIYRPLRGGSWTARNNFAGSSANLDNASFDAWTYSTNTGFRLTTVAVPEPSTWVMGAVGIACASWSAWRRRKAAA